MTPPKITFEVLSGSQDVHSPVSYLLQIGKLRFLLDCGLNNDFDQAYLDLLRRKIEKIKFDAVLLSFGDILHVGALPFVVAKCGLNSPIYATVPVAKLGPYALRDWIFSRKQNGDKFDLFGFEDIGAVFERVKQLRYSQKVSISTENGETVEITPLNAGKMLGGAIWKISKLGEEQIAYATEFSLRKEFHLKPCTFDGISRPNLLITGAWTGEMKVQKKPKSRNKELSEMVFETLRNKGDVLLVTDCAWRVLELVRVLDDMWHKDRTTFSSVYSLVCMSHQICWVKRPKKGKNGKKDKNEFEIVMGNQVFEMAKTLTEWMTDEMIQKEFKLKHVQVCNTMEELNALKFPKIVLVSEPDMDCGFSRKVFLDLSSNSMNNVILTTRGSPKSLARSLLRIPMEKSEKARKDLAAAFTDWELKRTNGSQGLENCSPRPFIGMTTRKRKLSSQIEFPVETSLTILCRVSFIDFDSQSTFEDQKDILNRIRPKQVILARGSKAGISQINGHCRKMGIPKERIFAPRLGAKVDATIQSDVYQVELASSLTDCLEFQTNKNNISMTWLNSQCRKSVKNCSKKVEPLTFEALAKAYERKYINKGRTTAETEKPRENSSTTTVALNAISTVSSVPPHRALFIDNPSISDVMDAMAAQGFQTRLEGGTLYVNQMISIKKLHNCRFQLEGVTCDDFYRVRTAFYEQFSML